MKEEKTFRQGNWTVNCRLTTENICFFSPEGRSSEIAKYAAAVRTVCEKIARVQSTMYRPEVSRSAQTKKSTQLRVHTHAYLAIKASISARNAAISTRKSASARSWFLHSARLKSLCEGETSCWIKPVSSCLFCLYCVTHRIPRNIYHQYEADFMLLSSSWNPLSSSIDRHFSVSRLFNHSTQLLCPHVALFGDRHTLPFGSAFTMPFPEQGVTLTSSRKVMEFGHSWTGPDQSVHFLCFSFSLVLPYLAPVYSCSTIVLTLFLTTQFFPVIADEACKGESFCSHLLTSWSNHFCLQWSFWRNFKRNRF